MSTEPEPSKPSGTVLPECFTEQIVSGVFFDDHEDVQFRLAKRLLDGEQVTPVLFVVRSKAHQKSLLSHLQKQLPKKESEVLGRCILYVTLPSDEDYHVQMIAALRNAVTEFPPGHISVGLLLQKAKAILGD